MNYPIFFFTNHKLYLQAPDVMWQNVSDYTVACRVDPRACEML